MSGWLPVEPSEITPVDPARSGLGVENARVGGSQEGRVAPDRTGDEPPVARPHRQGFEWLMLVGCSLAVALLVRAFFVQAFYIPSESMVPTLHKNDRVLVNKLSYKLHDIHRGDIVVFEAPPGTATNEVKDLIKRVIGLPGESIEGRGGNIYIDGRLIDEPYLPADVRSREFPPEKIPPDHYWVLGDNRLDSRDSTFFKSIAQSAVVGRAFVRIWPIGKVGLI
jgi:signal peptidase I